MKVVIVGAGLSGLVSAKECLAEGLEIDVFEALPYIGGQWVYSDPDPETGEVMSSIYKGVIMNSCRDTSSFTDFPLDPTRYPPFMDHELQAQYLREYAEFYDLSRHIQLNTKVVKAEPLENGSWRVTYQSIGGEPAEQTYDALIACSGKNTFPNEPSIPGKELFEGDYLHSHFYRSPSLFDGKRVAIIGLGSSAVDIGCELVSLCKEVHVISRRGAWVVPRFVLGRPAEAWDGRIAKVVPTSIAEGIQRAGLRLLQGKFPPELKPDHGVFASIPLVRGEFIERVKTGKIRVHRASIESFDKTGIALSDGSSIKVDAIIACTGFRTKFPYLPEDVLSAPASTAKEWQALTLYKLVKPVKYSNIFMVGLADAAGPAAPLYEAQARWAVSVIVSRISTPTEEQQIKAVQSFQLSQQKATVASERHTFLVQYMEYIDEMLRPLGANPTLARMGKLALTSGHPFREFKTASALYMQLAASAQWRLFGHGAKTEWAVESLLRVTSGKAEMTSKEKELLDSLRRQGKI